MNKKIFHQAIILILFCISESSYALDISDMKDVSKYDIALMSPACRLIVVEKPGIHHGAGDQPLAEYKPLFEKPEYRIAAANPHYHHYCYSELRQIKYFRARNSKERNELYKNILKDFNYVLENSPKDWPYFHVILVKLATVMYYHKEYFESLKRVEEALRLKDDYDRAYALKSNIYVMLKDKDKALKTLAEGLDKSPDSKVLQKMLSTLQEKQNTVN